MENRENDELLFVHVLNELDKGIRYEALWIKAYAMSGGVDEAIKPTYIQYRVKQIHGELISKELDYKDLTIEQIEGILDQDTNDNQIMSKEELFISTEGHIGCINTVAISKDNAFIVTGGNDRKIKLWDLQSGLEVRTFIGSGSAIKEVFITSDNKYIVSSHNTGTKTIWELHTGIELDIKIQDASYTNGCMAISDDEHYLVTLHDSKTIILRDLYTATEIQLYSGHNGSISSLAISKDNKYIVSGSFDKEIILWDLNTGLRVNSFYGHRYEVTAVAISNDNRYIVSAEQSCCKLWDVMSGELLRTFKGFTGTKTSIAITNDNKYIVSGHPRAVGKDTSEILVRHLDSGEELKRFTSNIKIISFTLSEDNQYLIISGEEGEFKVYDFQTTNKLNDYQNNVSIVDKIFVDKEHKTCISIRDDRIDMLDIESGIKTHSRRLPNYFYYLTSLSQDNQFLVGVDRHEVIHVRYLDGIRGYRSLESSQKTVDFNEILSLDISADNKYVVFSDQNTLFLWDLDADEIKFDYSCMDEYNDGFLNIENVSISSDSKNIIIVTDESVCLLKINDKSFLEIFKRSRSYSEKCYVDQNIITSVDRNNIILYDCLSGSQINSVTLSDELWWAAGITSVCYSDDGRYMISVMGNVRIILWDIKTNQVVKNYYDYSDQVISVKIINNNYILVHDDNGGIKLLSIDKGNEIYRSLSFKDNEWVSMTKEYYFTSSEHGQNHISRRLTSTKTSKINGELFKRFNRKSLSGIW